MNCGAGHPNGIQYFWEDEHVLTISDNLLWKLSGRDFQKLLSQTLLPLKVSAGRKSEYFSWDSKAICCSFLRVQRLETIQLRYMYDVQHRFSMQFLSYRVGFFSELQSWQICLYYLQIVFCKKVDFFWKLRCNTSCLNCASIWLLTS